MAEIHTLPLIDTKARACVRRGARMLDKRIPGWWDKLDLEGFDISAASCCVIGQLAQTDMEAFYREVGKAMGSGDYGWGIDVLCGINTRLPWYENGVYRAFTAQERAAYEERLSRRNQWAYEHGFEADIKITYPALQEAWIAAIAVRRGTTREALWALRAYQPLDWYDNTEETRE